MKVYKKIKELYLQMFADDDGDDGAGAGDGDQGDGGSSDGDGKGEEKTFTQSEMDKVVGKEKAKAAAKAEKTFKSSDEYKSYQEYVDNKKSADEKVQDQLKDMGDLKTSNQKLQTELDSLKNEKKLGEAGVNPDFKDFALHEINKTVNDDTDFDAALEAWKGKESNAKYIGETQQTNPKTGKRQNSGGSGQAGSRQERMLNQLGYGPKDTGKK